MQIWDRKPSISSPLVLARVLLGSVEKCSEKLRQELDGQGEAENLGEVAAAGGSRPHHPAQVLSTRGTKDLVLLSPSRPLLCSCTHRRY